MPISTLLPYVDGWFGPEREITVIPSPTFPFANNPTPDKFSRVYERKYEVIPRLYLPKIANRTAWTNLLTYSEDFTNVAWTGAAVTPSIVTTPVAPDGNATLNKILETAADSAHLVEQDVVVAAKAYEVSAFAIAGLGRSWLNIIFADSASTYFTAFFNITSGYIGQLAAGVTAKIVPLGLGQYRCVMRFTPAAGTGGLSFGISTDGNVNSYPGDITKGIYLWGTQITLGTETPYISTTSVARAISAPDRDKVDPMGYMASEADPIQQNSEASMVARKFSRVPLTQTVPTSLQLSKPALSGTFPQVFGAFRLFQPDTTLLKYDAYSAQAVTSDSGIPAFYPTGGTYTLSFAGSTTGAINYNDNAATVQTALNALTPVSNRGNVVVTGSYNSAGGFTITFNTYALLTLNVGSITVSSGSAIDSSGTNLINSGYTQFAQIGVSVFGQIVTGGTFTITIFGQTTGAIAYNATAATVQTALNALSEVQTKRGGCIITLPNDGRTTILDPNSFNCRFTVQFSNAALTGTASSLTPAGATITGAISDGIGVIQTVSLAASTGVRTIFAMSHGLALTDTLYIKGGSTYYAAIAGTFVLPNANMIALTVAAAAAYAGAGTITEVGKRTKQNYAPGIANIRANAVTSFYLPGVTTGITTASDIPVPTAQSDATPFLQAVFAGTGSINFQVGQLQPWMLGQILELTKTTLLAADV